MPKIKIKNSNSSSIPTLDDGEVAVNVKNKTLYVGYENKSYKVISYLNNFIPNYVAFQRIYMNNTGINVPANRIVTYDDTDPNSFQLSVEGDNKTILGITTTTSVQGQFTPIDTIGMVTVYVTQINGVKSNYTGATQTGAYLKKSSDAGCGNLVFTQGQMFMENQIDLDFVLYIETPGNVGNINSGYSGLINMY